MYLRYQKERICERNIWEILKRQGEALAKTIRMRHRKKLQRLKKNNLETADTMKTKGMTPRDTSYQKPINLSSKELEKSEIDLMVKGPSFVPLH